MSEWISVKDKLPPENSRVLAWNQELEAIQLMDFSEAKGFGWEDLDEGMIWCGYKEYAYWTPLPEAPKE